MSALTPEQTAFRASAYPLIELADKTGNHAPLLELLEHAKPVIGRIHRRLFEDTEDPSVASILLLMLMDNEKIGSVSMLEYYLFGDPIETLFVNAKLLGADGPQKLRRLAAEEGFALPR